MLAGDDLVWRVGSGLLAGAAVAALAQLVSVRRVVHDWADPPERH